MYSNYFTEIIPYAGYDIKQIAWHECMACGNGLQMDPQTAKKMMRDVDAARNRYHKAYIPGWQSVFDHKDLMIDSSRFGIDGTAKILADIVRNQWG